MGRPRAAGLSVLLSARDRDQDARSRPRSRRAARRQDPGLCGQRLAPGGRAAGRSPRHRIARRLRHRARQSGVGAGAGRGVGLRRRQRGCPPARATAERFHPASLSGHAVARRLSASRRPGRRRQGAAFRWRCAACRPQGQVERGTARSGLVGDRRGLGRRDRRDRCGRARRRGDLGDERLDRAAMAADRLVPCRAAAGGRGRRPGAQAAGRNRSAAAQGRRFQRPGGAHQSRARPGHGAHRRLPQASSPATR